MTRLLFVCSRNRLRSPTAEQVFASVPGFETRSAGTARDAETRLTAGLIEWADARYLLVGVTAWKLAVCYWLYTLQSRCYGLYEYFGGKVRSGLYVVLAALFLAPALMRPMPGFLRMVLG